MLTRALSTVKKLTSGAGAIGLVHSCGVLAGLVVIIALVFIGVLAAIAVMSKLQTRRKAAVEVLRLLLVESRGGGRRRP